MGGGWLICLGTPVVTRSRFERKLKWNFAQKVFPHGEELRAVGLFNTRESHLQLSLFLAELFL